MIFNIKPALIIFAAVIFVSGGLALATPHPAFAADKKDDKKDNSKADDTYSLGRGTTTSYSCGGGDDAIETSINFGCSGKGNAILDVGFALVRFLSNGVGLVIIGSLIWGGIQYSGSRGDPQATALAVNRMQSTFFALLLFIFGYALLNYLIPEMVLK